MQTRSLFALGLFFVFGGSVCAAGERSVITKVAAMGGSRESGTATFIAQGDKTLVIVDLQNAPPNRQPAHLHAGVCDDYAPSPAYALADVVGGKSATVVNERFERVTSGRFIVNVHKSYDEMATQFACGIVK